MTAKAHESEFSYKDGCYLFCWSSSILPNGSQHW